MRTLLLALFIFVTVDFAVAQDKVFATTITEVDEVDNPNNALEENGFATVNSNAGSLLGFGAFSGRLELEFDDTKPAGTTSYIHISGYDANLLNALLGGSLGGVLAETLGVVLFGNKNFEVRVRNNTTNVLTVTNGDIPSDNRIRVVQDELGEFYIAVTPNQDYNRIRFRSVIGSLLGFGAENNINVHSIFSYEGDFLCAEPAFTDFDGTGLTLDLLDLGGTGVQNPENAIDDDRNSFSQISVGVLGVAASIRQNFYFPIETQSNQSIEILLGTDPSLLDVGLLNNVTIEAYNQGNLVASGSLSSFIDLDLLTLLQNNERVSIYIEEDEPIDEVRIRLATLASVDLLQSLDVYYVGFDTPRKEVNAPDVAQCGGVFEDIVGISIEDCGLPAEGVEVNITSTNLTNEINLTSTTNEAGIAYFSFGDVEFEGALSIDFETDVPVFPQLDNQSFTLELVEFCIWNGIVDSDFNNENNWDLGTTPEEFSNIMVLASASNPMVVNDEYSSNKLHVENEAIVDLNSVDFNVLDNLEISGDVIGEGYLNVNGDEVQEFTGKANINYIRFSNPTQVVVKDSIVVNRVLEVSEGELEIEDGAGHVLLPCKFVEGGPSQVAQVGRVFGTVNGDFTTEQCFPKKRAFRFIAASSNTVTSMRENWQEDPENYLDDPNPGYGTHITGISPGLPNADVSQDGEDGFDYNPSGNPSIFQYDNLAQTWAQKENTTTTLNAGEPFRLMIRGGRSIDITSNATPPSNTIIRETGSITTGTVTFDDMNSAEDALNFIGNPYQAKVDMNQVLANSTNINTSMYGVWDPTINERGGFVVVSLPEGENTVGSDSNELLQIKQAAFVLTADEGVTPSIVFSEDFKVVEEPQLEVFAGGDNKTLSYINVRLHSAESYSRQNIAFDGIRINFDNQYQNTVVDDYPKLNNPDENLARINAGKLVSVEHRKMPVEDDILSLFIDNYKTDNYVLEFDLKNVDAEVYLKDLYTEEIVLIDSSNFTYEFNVDSNIPKSIDSERFQISFDNTTLGVDEFTESNLSLYPNPSENGVFSINGDTDLSNSIIEIYDTLGKKVFETKNESDSNVEVTDFRANSGIYFVKIKQESGVTDSLKLMIK